jgi:hypothetical protein
MARIGGRRIMHAAQSRQGKETTLGPSSVVTQADTVEDIGGERFSLRQQGLRHRSAAFQTAIANNTHQMCPWKWRDPETC